MAFWTYTIVVLGMGHDRWLIVQKTTSSTNVCVLFSYLNLWKYVVLQKVQPQWGFCVFFTMQIMTYAKLVCYLFRVYTSVEMFGVGKIFF